MLRRAATALCALALAGAPLLVPTAGTAATPENGTSVVALAAPPPPPNPRPPTKKECMTTLKILRGFKGYIKRYAPGTSQKRLKELERLLKEGKLRPNDLPAKVARQLPSRFFDKTIREIERECRAAQ